ncbi:uncharacterized protein LOC115212428 [Argonauta hians]
MHCTMGKDEYDKSKGGILKASALEQADNQVANGGKVDVVWDSPVSSFKNSSIDSSVGRHHGTQKNIIKSKEFASKVSQNKRIPPEKYVSDRLSSDNNDNRLDKSNGSLASHFIDIDHVDNNSDNEDLGLITHRPDINANQNIDLIKSTSNFSNTFTNSVNQSQRKKKDSKYNGEDIWRNNRKSVSKGKSDNFYKQSPSSTCNSYVMQDLENLAYQQHNYEQYVIPQNFAYTADDIYRKALSVGSYPNLITHKKVPEMFSFVNGLVSPPFFTRHPELRQQSQYYSTLPPDGNGCLHIAQQSPCYQNNSIHHTQDYLNTFYVDKSVDSRHHNVDYSDQHFQLQQNIPTANCCDTWRNQNGEEYCNAIERNKCRSNSKPIFRSRSLSAVEPSNLCPERGSPPQKSNYDFSKVEHSFQNFHIGHGSSDDCHFNQQSNPQRNTFNSLLAPENAMLQTFLHVCPECHSENTMNAQFCSYCGETLTERAQSDVYSQDSMYCNFREEDFSYPCDNDDNVFNETFSQARSFPNSYLQSSSNCRITKQPHRRQYQIQQELSHSFSPREHHAFHSGVSKFECYSDTEVTLQSPSTYKISSSCDWEDSSQDNLATPIFAMDEEMLNPVEQHVHSADSILDHASSSETDLQYQLLQENSEKHSGKYTGTKGPRKVWRKLNTSSGSIDGNRLFTANNYADKTITNGPVYHRHWEKSSCGSTSYLREPSVSSFSRKEVRKVVQQNGTTKNRKKVHSKKAVRVLSLMKDGKQQDLTTESERCFSSDVGSTNVPYSHPILQEHSATSESNLSDQPHFSKTDSDATDSPETEKKQSKNSTYLWQHLPDEIWLQIFSNLSNHARYHCALVSKRFNRIIQDESLWHSISLEKKCLQDDWLLRISQLHPSRLEFIQCHGDKVTAAGLNYLFKECANSLMKLCFSRCSRGELTGDKILHASTVCHNLTHVDASWCSVTDSGLAAIANSCDRLESLCLNGCGLMSDNGLKILVSKHSKSLQVLEMFGCFNITSRGIRHLASVCTNLRTLQLGQCYKLTDSCIAEVSSSLCCVQNLDLRGCKQIKDSCIEKIVANCSRLHTLALANCPNISNNAMQKIASTLPGIRSIDVCGCKLITDESVNRLAVNCRQLVYLDISSTGCTYKSICRLAEQGSNDLETLKLNFITGITENSLTQLTNSCKRLTTLHLYGCRKVRNLEKIQALHPNLIIESDRD